jgi:hypothetical protein
MAYIYRKLFYFILLVVVMGATYGCNIINPSEPIPTYVRIDSFEFTGSGLTDIKCITVFYNGNNIGSFDLPAVIPVVTSGNGGTLQVAPGIIVNGRNERPATYPFYKMAFLSLPEKPGEIINFIPKTNYYDSVVITKISDFNSGITQFSKASGTTSLRVVTDPSLVLEGTGSGAVYLNSSADSSIDSTIKSFPIKQGYSFLEFDYKTTTPFTVGVKANLGTLYSSNINYLAGVLPNNKWQKFYLNLSGFTTNYPADSYHFFIKAALQDQTNGVLLIDNIKLVTF